MFTSSEYMPGQKNHGEKYEASNADSETYLRASWNLVLGLDWRIVEGRV